MKAWYVNGRWASSTESEPVRSPWDGRHLADVALADAAGVEEAVAAAHQAFASTRSLSAAERSATLLRVAAAIGRRRRDFVDTLVAEAGKPITLAEAEVGRAEISFEMAAHEVVQPMGHSLEMGATPPGRGHFGLVRRFPMGVILGITPFNFPLNLVAHKVAPCLATGNTMVLKPALKTPLCSLLLAEVLHEAEVPAGQINVVPFDHAHIPALLQDKRIKMLSFTGSAQVGWRLKAEAVKMKAALELGGNAAVIVEPDPGWETAVPKIAAGAYGYAGQSCISVQRILVHARIYDAFREKLVAEIQAKIKAGDPSDPATVVGPMISASARDKVVGWIQEAEAAGARLLTPALTAGSSLLHPVLLEDAPAGCAVCREEAFAPLAVLMRYRDFSEALEQVNDSAFGLQAGVFTTNLNLALTAFEQLDVGGVMVNQVPTFRVENMPYGGVKDSGFGREGIRYTMEEMTEPRSLIIKLPGA